MVINRAWMALIAISMLVGACGTMTTTGSVVVNGKSAWALLPMQNYSTTPRAETSLKSIVETRLRARGIARLVAVDSQSSLSLVGLLDQSAHGQTALVQAREQGFRYALTGSVHEWHYKSGPDREPVVGISLKVLDLETDQVVWQGSAARSGWGYGNLASVADRLVRDMLKEVRIQG